MDDEFPDQASPMDKPDAQANISGYTNPSVDTHIYSPIHHPSTLENEHNKVGPASSEPIVTAPMPSPVPPIAELPQSVSNVVEADIDHPLAVTEVYSTYGIEYLIMFISLAASSISFASLVNSVIDLLMKNAQGTVGSFFNSYAAAALIVSFPVFAYLFLRLEAKEENEAALLNDASRRRGMQIVLVISFLAALFTLIGYVSSLFGTSSISQVASSYTGSGTSPAVSSGGSGFASFLHVAVSLVIAGGIFIYYWRKLHNKPKQY